MTRITKQIADKANPSESRRVIWDSTLPGFGLVVQPTGFKSYCYQYRNAHDQSRRITIGAHGQVTTDEARKRAKEYQSQVFRGIDPLGEKEARKAALSINDLLDRYFESAKFEEKTKETQELDISRLTNHARPLLGKLKLEKVTKEHIRRAFADIRDGKTARTIKTKARGVSRVKGGPGVARMVIRNLRAIFNWAISEGLSDCNPAQGIKIGTDGQRDVILETPEQYASLFRALDTLQERSELSDAAADAIRVIAFTGARRSEIAALRWGWVDLARGVLTLPPKAHKTGHRSCKPKIIALPAPARVILSARPQGEADSYVFQSTIDQSKHVELGDKIWSAIRAEAGLPDGIANHSLRHSLATLLAMQGASAPEIMATLGHSQMSTAQRYIHIAMNARTAIADKYTAGIAGVFSGAPKATVHKLSTKQ